MYKEHRTTERRTRALVWSLALAALLAVGLFLFTSEGDQNPARVLACTWERATSEGSATTDPACG